VVESENIPTGKGSKQGAKGLDASNRWSGWESTNLHAKILGYRPTCECDADSTPCRILDPFLGIGTTLQTARQMKRHGTGIELNPEYAAIAAEEIVKRPRWWLRKHKPKKRVADLRGQKRLFT
jgi:hypothetical protein